MNLQIAGKTSLKWTPTQVCF